MTSVKVGSFKGYIRCFNQQLFDERFNAQVALMNQILDTVEKIYDYETNRSTKAGSERKNFTFNRSLLKKELGNMGDCDIENELASLNE